MDDDMKWLLEQLGVVDEGRKRTKRLVDEHALSFRSFRQLKRDTTCAFPAYKPMPLED